MTWGMIGGAAVATVGGAMLSKGGGSQQSGNTTATQKAELDPRMQALLYGDGTDANKGLLSQVGGLANQQQGQGQNQFGQGMNSYLYNFGAPNFISSQQAAQRLQDSNLGSPSMWAANAMNSAHTDTAQVAAPSQNNMNLSGAYDKMINGDAGANPYLTRGLQAGVDQTNASFAKNQQDMTNNLQRNVLSGIRGNSILAGQYGGSRQGIAEGNAISDYTNQLNSSNTQLGLANSANTIGAQAQAFNQGQDRSLSALTGLSAQQYATAGQNAQLQQSANSQNSAQAQQAQVQNSNMQQGANQANLQANLSTNQLNSANQATGTGLSSGLLGQAYNYSTANDAYAGNKIGQAAGLLAPFAGQGGSSTSTQPYYTNTAGSILGGATGALGLYNSYKQATSGNGAASGQGIAGGGAAGQYYDGYGWMNG